MAGLALSRMDALADEALRLWNLSPGATTRRINVSENVTYLVEAGADRSVLRIHREGYHSAHEIECELAWMTALSADRIVRAPTPIAGRDGALVQRDAGFDMAMFDHIDGTHPDESSDLTRLFRQLGGMAARMHNHAEGWSRPAGFERHAWTLDTVFGTDPTWGDWRVAPNVDPDVRAVLERVEAVVSRRLRAFGNGPDRYGLIHADMRLANLILDPGGAAHLIDFDDCGFGWFLYDFAAAISFIEDDPAVPALREAWLDGYREVRSLTRSDEAEIDSFVMLRRLALLAWIGSHSEAPEPQALAPDFARVSAELGDAYLERFS